jgi:hypothetical protein
MSLPSYRHEIYQPRLKVGQLYEQYICDRLRDEHIHLVRTTTRRDQNAIGETYQGWEIKFDRLLHQTRNLFIEHHEKTNPTNRTYVESGFLRRNNTLNYLQGDYARALVFAPSVLRMLSRQRPSVESDTKTSLGFLITWEDAFQRAERCFTWSGRLWNGEKSEDVPDQPSDPSDPSPRTQSQEEIDDQMRDIGRHVFGIQYDTSGVAQQE